MSARRDEILGIARRLFADRGYLGTSMRDIADAAGVLPGSLYTHFKSKAQMIQEIMLGLYAELLPAQREAAVAPGKGAQRLEAMIDATYACCARFPDELTILHYDQNEISTLDELDEVRQLGAETLNMWIKVIEGGVADGSLKRGLAPEMVMRIVTSAIHGLLDTVRYRNRRNAKSKAEPVAVLKEVMLHGLQS